MREAITPGAQFPDYQLPDHTKTLRRLSDLQGDQLGLPGCAPLLAGLVPRSGGKPASCLPDSGQDDARMARRDRGPISGSGGRDQQPDTG